MIALAARTDRQALEQLSDHDIDALPETYRAMFALREIEQLSIQKTADFFGLEPGAVKTRVHRARRLLQQRLTAEISAALRGAHAFDGERCDRLGGAGFSATRHAAAFLNLSEHRHERDF